MLDISFEINGWKVHPDQIGNELEKAVFRQVRDDLVRKVGSIQDPETGRPPKITVKGRNLKNLSFEVQGSER